MAFKSLVFFATLALTSTVVASPLDKRGDGVFICSENNWQGDCIHIIPPSGCLTISAFEGTSSPFLGSIGPDPGVTCTLFDNFNCIGSPDGNPGSAETTITNPGTGFPDSYWEFNTHTISCFSPAQCQDSPTCGEGR